MPERQLRLALKPQVNLSRSTAVRMWLLVICALLIVLQSSFNDLGASFAVAFVAFLAAVLAELLITQKQYGFQKIMDGSAAASGLILALMLPNQITPVYAAMGAVFAMVVVKHSFGGLGANRLNPALAGWLFIRLSWPDSFTKAIDGSVPAAVTPFEYLPQAGSAADGIVGGFLNKYVFSFFSADLPSGYLDLFALQSPGIIADRAVLALVLSTVAISAVMISRLRLSVIYLFVFSLLVKLFGDLPAGGSFWNGDVILALLSGGTLLTAFVLIAEPSGGAKSVTGGIVLAAVAALLAFCFRYFGRELYGGFYAAALVNAFTPLLCRAEGFLLYPRGAEGKPASSGNNAVKGDA
jgi:electron transport complex protein RnfD